MAGQIPLSSDWHVLIVDRSGGPPFEYQEWKLVAIDFEAADESVIMLDGEFLLVKDVTSDQDIDFAGAYRSHGPRKRIDRERIIARYEAANP